ncbi:nucleotidyltransferase domain-containing protein [Nocardiopsis sp. N85]|uniref:nucleotidyltransferase domain-containing protein n=1 Tax=Nocardiopsis sp. N85 TaxID=3029400 RepID=UPI00237F6B58|nr:nucleotidyltransferase domain-containing protein [Nocardiopsis sp. N85]MDE3725004.1 nucleotidyltransferase domain-containing protein [Nocardiopsis sp. N85]
MDEHEDKGLNADGTIAREGSLDLVDPVFAPVVEAARERIARTYGDALHGAYLYGSVPRGTARPGRSDLDLMLVFHEPPTEGHRAAARLIEAEIDAAFEPVDGVGVLLEGAAAILDDPHDGGFFVSRLCTPLFGADLADRLPAYRPTSLLARETNGDLYLFPERWRARAADADTEAAVRALVRGSSRKTLRSAFTLVMPVWGGWTSDLTRSAEVVGRYHPEWAGPLWRTAEVALDPAADRGTLRMIIDDLAPRVADEYRRVHGEKAPR